MPKLLGAGLAAVVTGILLAGCSAAPPATTGPTIAATSPVKTQSQTEACLALITALGPGALVELTSVLGDLSSDPASALKPLKEFADTLSSAAATVTNAKVKAQADRLSAALKNLITQVQKAIKSPKKLSGLNGAIQRARTELTAMGTTCAGV